MISKTIREPSGAVKKRFPRNMKPFFIFRLVSYLKKVNFSKALRLFFCVITAFFMFKPNLMQRIESVLIKQ